MERDERSERSRRAVLDAALHLFAHRGYRGTSVRDIAERARISTGTVYHYFPDKEAVFRTLLDEFYAHTQTTAFPFTRAVSESKDFPANLEQLGFAARDSVRQCRDYIALMYVDMIEFGARHVDRFYSAEFARFDAVFEKLGGERIQSRLRPSVTPGEALDLAHRMFFHYFSREILFGIERPFGYDSTTAVQKMADLLRNGICAEPKAEASEALESAQARRAPRGQADDHERHAPAEDHRRDDAHQPRGDA